MFAFLLHWIGLTRARHCCRDCETPKFQLGHFFICVPRSKMIWLRLCDSNHRSLKSPWTNLMKYLCFSIKELDASSPVFLYVFGLSQSPETAPYHGQRSSTRLQTLHICEKTCHRMSPSQWYLSQIDPSSEQDPKCKPLIQPGQQIKHKDRAVAPRTFPVFVDQARPLCWCVSFYKEQSDARKGTPENQSGGENQLADPKPSMSIWPLALKTNVHRNVVRFSRIGTM